MISPSLFDFDGSTYNPTLDKQRLNTQLHKVQELMSDSKWRTLQEISASTGSPQASVSARLRDLRKKRFGNYTVNRRRRLPKDKGLFEYQVIDSSTANSIRGIKE